MNTKTESNPTETWETIKLGIDAHAKWYYVARQIDGATPQPIQKMSFEGLLRFVARQQRLAREVHACYEAVSIPLFAPLSQTPLPSIWTSTAVILAYHRRQRFLKLYDTLNQA